MSLKLYHHPPSRSVRVVWALKELGIEAEVVTAPMDHAALKKPEYRALNPLGKTPVLFDGDKRIIESNAINEYLAHTYAGGKLARLPGDADYVDYLQWFHFGEAGMGSYVNQMIMHSVILPEDKRNPFMKQWAEGEIKNCLDYFDAETGDDGYVLGDFSLADISIGYLLFLLKITKNGASFSDKTNAYFKRITSRPAWKEATS